MAQDAARRAYHVGVARTRRELRGETRFHYAPRVDWDEHAAELSEVWKPGDHVSIFAPTDHGKTHLVLHGLAPLWPDEYPWLTVDVKGDDPTLAGWGRAVQKLPGRFVRHRVHEGQRYRLLVPEAVEALGEAKGRVLEALRTCRRERGWVVHLNEVRALTDAKAPGLGLAPNVEQLWLRGRPHITVIGETQRPAWVPGSMYDQPSHVYLGGIVDERSRKRIAEIGGDTDNLIRIVRQLREHEFLYFRRLGGLMQIVTAPARSR
jgi:hypothetical protein